MYSAHFGLREQPFGLTPDLDYLYADAQHQAALDLAMRALLRGDGFVKITGEVGTGKTLLCRRLMAALPASVVTAYLCIPHVDPQAVLKAVASELDVLISADADAFEVHRALEAELRRLTLGGHRVVLCVDEAHALPPAALEALRLLSNLETDKRKLIQVVLVGQRELDGLLRHDALRSLASRIEVSLSLGSLPYQDFRRYLKHRLMVSGWQGPKVFSDGATQILWRASKGIPRLGNVLAHQCLARAQRRGVHRVCCVDALTVWIDRWRTFDAVSGRSSWATSWQGGQT
ncbi:MAG TPA: AAA family ATPase [Aquabacterium sp.]|nr:AAA family ATPase [Aquabacterium sp.]